MATEADIKNWMVNEYGNRDFNQLCQALMWQLCNRFGSAPVSYASALDAWYATPTAGTGYPPAGAHTFWDIGAYGHVGFQLQDSGPNFMGTSRTAEDWGWTNRGWQDFATYASLTGARFLGWGWTNGANSFTYDAGGGGGGGSTDYAFGLNTAAQSALQEAMNKQNPPYYTGPVDGEFGANSVKGMQQWLKDMGYLPSDYEVDGIPGPSYGKALQTLARDRGIPPYTGPIDGAPGENTSISLTGWAPTTWSTTPPPDPDPTFPTVPAGTAFGVDLGTSQAGFDFTAFTAAGGAGAIIKAGGGNASDSPYVAPEYRNQVPAARAAGTPVGHYWFNGRQNGLTPTTSAQFFAANLQLEEGDLVALDVEDETATGTTAYSSAEAHEFANALRAELGDGLSLGIYANSTVWNSGDWSWIEAEGHWRWPAKWNANDGTAGTPPDEPWAVWQFTSLAGPIPGWGSESLDGNAVKADAWSTYGYQEEDPGPGPDPEPDPDLEALVGLLGEFFGDFAALGEKYQELLTQLDPPTARRRRH